MSKQGKKYTTSYASVINQRDEKIRKGNKPIIGIDIGSSAVKIVQIRKNKISKWGMETIPEGMLNQGRIEASVQLAEIIKRTLKENKIQGSQCALCLSGNEVIVRELKLPELSENQIMENIKHELTSFLPLNHEEYCIDYKVLDYKSNDDGTPGNIRIMVSAVPTEIVHAYINTLKKANLKVIYVDVVPNIAGKLAKWMMLNHNEPISNSNLGFLDIGARTTSITIIKDGNYSIHKTINNGGDYLTSQIAEKLHIDQIEAEVFKKKANFFENNFRNNECLFVKNIIDYLFTDLERTFDFYKNRNNQKGIDRIYLMGGGSLLKGLPEYIREHFNLEVSFLSDSLLQFQKNKDYANKIVAYSQAVGATLREE